MPLMPEHAALSQLIAAVREPEQKGLAGRVTASTPAICSVPDTVLAARRSARRFTSRPVPAAVLTEACRAGMLAERACWPADVHGDAGLRVAVAVRRVQGLTAGIHALSATEADFRYLGGDALADSLRQEYVSAPVFVLVYGNLGQAQDLSSRTSYQNTLVRAAAIGYTILVNTMTAGLQGCPFGRAMTEVSVLLRANHEGWVNHLFTLAIGWPAEIAPPLPAVG